MFKIGDKVKVYDGDEYFHKWRGTITRIFNEIVDIDVGQEHEIIVNKTQLRRDYTHISPSALKTFTSNKDEFYRKYIARHVPPSIPQNEYMAVGSSFDAFVKHELMKDLNHSKKQIFNELYNSQVEEQNRDSSLSRGAYCLEVYKQSGAYSDLMLELAGGEKEPNLEFDLKGSVQTDNLSIPIGGKPDLHFVNAHGARVVLDFKVNGFFSKAKTSPKPHYNVAREQGNLRKYYKNAMCQNHKGIEVNIAVKLEHIDEDWATQTCMYGWLLGEPIGSDFICAIEQLLCNRSYDSERPEIRVVSYRCFVSREFQLEVLRRLKDCYQCLTGQFYPELTETENRVRCYELEKMCQTCQSNVGNSREEWFDNMVRSSPKED